ncbi:hypothetical protein MY11210_000384 [Beauveria gryllotalpidicola]
MLHTKIPVIIVALAGYGLSAADADETTNALSAEEFLAKYPEIAVGRDALNRARQGIDDSLTFTAVTQPASNVVLVQAFTEGADPQDLHLAFGKHRIEREPTATDAPERFVPAFQAMQFSRDRRHATNSVAQDATALGIGGAHLATTSAATADGRSRAKIKMGFKHIMYLDVF